MQFSSRTEKLYLRSAKTEQAAVHVRESKRNGAMEIAKPRQLAGATAESKMTNGDSMMQLTVPHSASTIKYFAIPRRSLIIVKTRFYTYFEVHRKKMPDDISPFSIRVPDTAIEQLKAKLSAAAFADRVEFSDDWNYGAPLSDVKRLAKRWEDGFDWREQEATLNQLPHFTTPIEVDGFGKLNIHFLHQRSSNANSIPLLFVHGCPSSSACELTHELTRCRAGQLFRSRQAHPATDRVQRQAIFPRSGAIFAKLWFLRCCAEAWFQHNAICRNCAQVDAKARLHKLWCVPWQRCPREIMMKS